MSEASNLREDAKLGIADHLRALVLTQIVAGDYDAGSQTTAQPVATEHDGVGKIGTYSDRVIDGTRITARDRLVTFFPADIAKCPPPKPSDTIGPKDGPPEEIMLVIEAKKREAGGELICWTIQARLV